MKTKLYFIITLFAFFTLIVLPSGFAQEPLVQPSVRLVYLLPNDRIARPDKVIVLRQLIKELYLQGNRLKDTSTLFQLRGGTFPPNEAVEVTEA